eukprot:m.4736 g.4736  ORF g.4736 m.4736 type:complete len:671 (-) comp4578_c0_seq1:60-2072(-)
MSLQDTHNTSDVEARAASSTPVDEVILMSTIPAPIPFAMAQAARSKKTKRSAKRKAGASGKNQSYTIQRKMEVLKEMEERKLSYRAAAKVFQVPAATLAAWKKNLNGEKQQQLVSRGLAECKRVRSVRFPLINELMEKHIVRRYQLGLVDADAFGSTSWALLQHRALRIRDALVQKGHTEYESFAASPSWLSTLLKRIRFTGSKLHGEGGSVIAANAQIQMAQFINRLKKYQLKSPAQVFNMDETGLFFGQTSTYALVPTGELLIAHGSKRMTAKDRVSVLACVSCDGSKLPLLVVGKAAKPSCFRAQPIEHLKPYVRYTAQANAWVDRKICQDWFDTVFVPHKRRLLGTEQLAVLVWDNCSAHSIHNVHKDIAIELLPPNMASKHQLLDQGVLSVLKAMYKSEVLFVLDGVLDNWEQHRAEAKAMTAGHSGIKQGSRPNMSDVCSLLSQCWRKLPVDCIINCACKANFLPRQLDAALRVKTPKGLRQMQALDEYLQQQLAAPCNAMMHSFESVVDKTLRLQLDLEAMQDHALLETQEFLQQSRGLMSQPETDKVTAMLQQVTLEDRPDVIGLMVEQMCSWEEDLDAALVLLDIQQTADGGDQPESEEDHVEAEQIPQRTFSQFREGLDTVRYYLHRSMPHPALERCLKFIEKVATEQRDSFAESAELYS